MTLTFNTFRRHIKEADGIAREMTGLVERARVLSEALQKFGASDPRTVELAMACGVTHPLNAAMLADGVRLGRMAARKLEQWLLDVRESGADERVLEMDQIYQIAGEAESELNGGTNLLWLSPAVLPALQALVDTMTVELGRRARFGNRAA